MSNRIQLVVLDDDPTGIQTVHGCYVLTRWDSETLREALADSHDFFYVLTNTRGRTPSDARETISEIVTNVLHLNAGPREHPAPTRCSSFPGFSRAGE